MRVRVPMMLIWGGVAFLLVGCGGSDSTADRAVVPADLILAAGDLPAGYEPAQLTVKDLVEGNRGLLATARESAFTPEQCRPVADGSLNPQLTEANSAIVAARDTTGTLVLLVTTAQRDIISDIATMTGSCARTTAVVASGSMRGARIVTSYLKLADPTGEGVQQSVVVRSEVTTTLPDGTSSAQIGYAGYASVLPDGAADPVTVQLTVAGEATPAATPTPGAVEPMTAAEFGALFEKAVRTAADAR